ncbi:uncharacterized protein LOC110869544 [Helianthus annuus]|uniref:uncharacterized protein LOC110869544 n=1 Tax=Helianthus annuus TaxID=4232 RepID=UPI000B8F9C68|nr:uncharacterized protein LOC110869544 [Helianthus annuus]
MDSKIHLTVSVSNIKNLIPVTLEMERGQYGSWCELFENHCRACMVIDHLSPKTAAQTTSTKDADKAPAKAATDDSWDRLDAIVLQWIYSTISSDLLHTILKPDNIAHEAWTTLQGIFKDNKSSRAIHLMHKFSGWLSQYVILLSSLESVG